MNRNRFAAFAAGTMITAASIELVAAPAEADTRRFAEQETVCAPKSGQFAA